MQKQRLLAACAFVLLAAALFAPAFFGGRLFFPAHTEQLLPWRTEVPAERLADHAARANLALTDKLWLFDPDTALLAAEWRAGRLPTWNPSIVGGAPFLGQALYGALYPPNVLLWLWLPVEESYAWGAALHVVIAGFGVYLFLRQLGVAPGAALLGGILFAAGGPLVVRYHYYMTFYPVAWVPWLLAAVQRFAVRRTLGAWTLVPLPIGLMILTGFPQTALYGIVGAALFGAIQLVRARGRAAFFPGLALAAAFGLGGALAAAQVLPYDDAARQGLPRRHDVDQQIREAGSPWMLLSYAIPDLFQDPREPWSQVLWRNPLWSGIYAVDAHVERQPDGSLLLLDTGAAPNPTETACYAGGLGLLLALGALLGRPTRLVGGLVAALALCWAYAIGWAPLVRLVALLPRMDVGEVRRIIPTTGLLFAALAAAGAARLLDPAARGRRRACLVVGGLLVLALGALFVAIDFAGPGRVDAWLRTRLVGRYGAELVAQFMPVLDAWPDDVAARATFLAGRIGGAALWLAAAVGALYAAHRLLAGGRTGLAAGLLAVAAVADLASYHFRYNPFVPAEGFLAPDPALVPLAAERTGGRVRRFAPGYRLQGSDTIAELVLPPNLGARFGIEDVEGYIVAVPARMAALLRRLEPGTPADPSVTTVTVLPLRTAAGLTSPLLDLLGVRQVLTRVDLLAALGAEGHGDGGFRLAAERGEVRVYENLEVRPLARVLPEAGFVAPESGELRAALLDDLAGQPAGARTRTWFEGAPPPPVPGELTAYSIRRTTLAPGEPAPGAALLADRPLLATRGTPARVRSIHKQAARVVVDLEPGDGGFLVVAEGYDPGWRAFADGREVPVHAADVAFRGVVLPMGTSQVVFTYDPKSVRRGLQISFASLGLLLLGALTACATGLRRGSSPRAAARAG